MTTIQFANVLARTRTVESSNAPSARSRARIPTPAARSGENGEESPDSTLASTISLPQAFHWSYQPAVIAGKRVAKRTPQLADSAYWSFAINRLG